MKNNVFSIIFLTAFLTVICFTVSCSKVSEISPEQAVQSAGAALISAVNETPLPGPAAAATVEPAETAAPTPRATAPEPQATAYISEEIKITYSDPVTQKTYTKITPVEDKNDVSAALEAVKQTVLPEAYSDIKVNKVVQNDGNIFIDFTDSVYMLAENPSEEYPALEAIADAYLNNIEGAKGVYFTVNGGGYSSMNMEYDADEPFKTKS